MIAASERLLAEADAIAERVVAQMYRNPFWNERFGARGREFAVADNHHHINYLVEALRAATPDLLVSYAQWVRTVLTTRGMCTRHVVDNFALLAAALPTEAAPGVAYLEEACAGLTYPSNPQRMLQMRATEIANTATDSLATEHPPCLEQLGEAARTRSVDDLEYHLSFLADALALARDDVFLDYVDWIAAFHERRGIERACTRAALEALARTLEFLHLEARMAALRLLDLAVVRLRERR